jgi:hypothetical protein
MPYYDADSEFEKIRGIISDDIRAGLHSLTASLLVRRHNLRPSAVQKVLADLASVGDLETHFIVLCSGEHHNLDADREYRAERDIPSYSVTCSKCGDLYVPTRENILLSFEPTSAFKEYLHKAS